MNESTEKLRGADMTLDQINRRIHDLGIALLYCEDESRREVLLAEREGLILERTWRELAP